MKGGNRATLLVTLVIAVALAAVLGAYIDWMWWLDYAGIILTLAAVAIVLVGAVVALVGRGIARRGGLVALAVGIGLLAGQNLGPAREPLIYATGTMTVRLDSPVVAVASGEAVCANVASETEFQASGNVTFRFDQLGRVADQVYVDVGDRWEALEGRPRSDGIAFSIMVTDLAIPDSGAPTMAFMVADESSTLGSTFTNQGGSIRFAGLVRQARPDLTGAPMDLAGMIDWTCDEVVH